MSYLFHIEGNVVNPNPEILSIFVFKSIWERDEDPAKVMAKKEFAYAEFMVSMLKTNPYRDYADDKKPGEIRKGIVMPEDWQPDSLVEQAIRYLIDVQTEGSVSYRYWIANKTVLEKQIEYFNDLDPGELNEKTGNPLYKPVDIPNAVIKAEQVLQTVNTLKAKVDEELYESNKNKGGKEISHFAQVDSLR